MNFEKAIIEEAVVIRGEEGITLLLFLAYCLVAGLTLAAVAFALT
jgi:hypothetical protein